MTSQFCEPADGVGHGRRGVRNRLRAFCIFAFHQGERMQLVLAELNACGRIGSCSRENAESFDSRGGHDRQNRPHNDAFHRAELRFFNAASARLPEAMGLFDFPAMGIPLQDGIDVGGGTDRVVREQPPVERRFAPRRRSDFTSIV